MQQLLCLQRTKKAARHFTISKIIIIILFLFRYVYRFVCDLQSLLGYSADELHSMVELGKLLQQHR